VVTQEEVAKEAGTSTAVVSYVINNGPRNVSEATRERVLAAVAKLGYRPNAVARSLRSASTRVIGLIAADITNPYCSQVAVDVEDAALRHGRTLLFGNAKHDDSRQARHLQTFIEQRVEGIIFIGSAYTDDAFLPETTAVLRGENVPPVVVLDRPGHTVGATTIQVDNQGGAYAATAHLLGHGHAEVASLSGFRELSSMRERHQGWLNAHRERGLTCRAEWQLQSAIDRYDAYRVSRELFSRTERPRAIFTHTDEQAIGVLYAAASLGLRVPRDLAVASFDDIREACIVQPSLTTARQPIAEAARLAVDVLLGDGKGGTVALPPMPLPTELVVRESCGCA
jgi:LacI family transcriptional regulator